MCLISTQWICLSSCWRLPSGRSRLISKLNFSVVEPPPTMSEWSMSPGNEHNLIKLIIRPCGYIFGGRDRNKMIERKVFKRYNSRFPQPIRLPSGVFGRNRLVSGSLVVPLSILSFWNCPSKTCPFWKTNFPLPCLRSWTHSPMYLDPLEWEIKGKRN